MFEWIKDCADRINVRLGHHKPLFAILTGAKVYARRFPSRL